MTPAVEYFVDQALWPNIFHVQLQRRFHQGRDGHMDAILLMPSRLDAVVHKSDQTSGHNCADKISVDIIGSVTDTYSATSVRPPRTLLSLIHNEQGGTQPPLASSSCASAGVRTAGTICAMGCEVSVFTR